MGKFVDLTGQKFGRLTVIRRADNKTDKVRWLCKCDCGNYHTTITNRLKSGLCKSCGCLNVIKHPELNLQRNKVNTYDLSGDYGIGYTSKGEEFYFDLEDYDKIEPYNWHKDSNGYIVASLNKHTKMHRLVMGATNPDIKVDHIYHNKFDNRKSQLRLVSDSQNQQNRGIIQSNTSGHTGVYWHKNKNKWESLIAINRKLKYLGMFDDYAQAVKVREKAEKEYFGEYRFKKKVLIHKCCNYNS